MGFRGRFRVIPVEPALTLTFTSNPNLDAWLVTNLSWTLTPLVLAVLFPLKETWTVEASGDTPLEGTASEPAPTLTLTFTSSPSQPQP